MTEPMETKTRPVWREARTTATPKPIQVEPVEKPKKRGRKATEKPHIILPDMIMDGEIEGTTTEKLKFMAVQVKQLDKTLDLEPYRMDIRMKKHDTIQRICYLIESL
jgi:hypothetical protein